MVLPVSARETTIHPDRFAVVAPPPNDMNTHNTFLAVNFPLTELPESTEIIYAELVAPLDFSDADIAGSIEFRARPIIHDWTPQSD